MSKYSSTQAEQIRKIATYLKEQRVKQGLSIEQIASMTFIRLPMLKALEKTDIEQLPELIYVQGFIRRYGEALGIDGYSLSHQINASEAEKPTISPNLVASPPQESHVGQEVPATLVNEDNNKSVAVKSKPRTLVHPSEDIPERSEVSLLKQLKLYWIYLVVLGGAIVGLFYLFSRPPATEQTAQTQETGTVTESTEPEATITISPTTTEPTEPKETIEPSSTVTESTATAPPTQPQEPTQTSENSDSIAQPETIISSEEPSPILESPQETPEATTSPSEVTETSAPTPTETVEDTISQPATEKVITAALQLEGDSWLQVSVDGKVEYEGILKEGEQQSWDAQETLTIRAGNAGAVKLSVNDKPAEVIGELGEVKTVEVTPDS
ncbi:helix-turn-helix domain-containing protein [Crocosphaera chwakensis]|uniref:Cytoskeleton protein RodZ-like C-terminal domain-containing protein n=1 Tax=Crocosphaera chwakensis CCY0110 TaxID=391612 RepID=A3IHP1_9CHRO|nr:helix-turn-helix domain-containing protein [Crocosphaera chwakensis]EAZ93323.1 hypothetical protein CY0110_16047 [Crocosphaera chwakensis CCY0110]